jgi:hypothetical protein
MEIYEYESSFSLFPFPMYLSTTLQCALCCYTVSWKVQIENEAFPVHIIHNEASIFHAIWAKKNMSNFVSAVTADLELN